MSRCCPAAFFHFDALGGLRRGATACFGIAGSLLGLPGRESVGLGILEAFDAVDLENTDDRLPASLAPWLPVSLAVREPPCCGTAAVDFGAADADSQEASAPLVQHAGGNGGVCAEDDAAASECGSTAVVLSSKTASRT